MPVLVLTPPVADLTPEQIADAIIDYLFTYHLARGVDGASYVAAIETPQGLRVLLAPCEHELNAGVKEVEHTKPPSYFILHTPESGTA